MADEQPTPKPKPKKPTHVVGSTLDHARKTAGQLGLPESAGRAVDNFADLDDGTVVVAAKVDGDRSALWNNLNRLVITE